MDIDKLFSEQDRRRIEEAVRAAERTTSGEIVPVVVARSNPYDEIVWRGATLGALAAALAAAVIHLSMGAWGIGPWIWIAGPGMLGAGLGFLVASLSPSVERVLAQPQDLEREVRQRASVAFLEHEVFTTKERTGILIFLSIFERRVVILGDAGINARVQQRDWDDIATELSAGIKQGQAAEALIAAIGRCGELLARRGVEIKPGDVDELPGRLRVEKE